MRSKDFVLTQKFHRGKSRTDWPRRMHMDVLERLLYLCLRLEHVGVDESMVLQCVKVLAGLSWLGVRSIGGLL
jgi:hypothetical protein